MIFWPVESWPQAGDAEGVNWRLEGMIAAPRPYPFEHEARVGVVSVMGDSGAGKRWDVY
jgi:hypothetical protein